MRFVGPSPGVQARIDEMTQSIVTHHGEHTARLFAIQVDHALFNLQHNLFCHSMRDQAKEWHTGPAEEKKHFHAVTEQALKMFDERAVFMINTSMPVLFKGMEPHKLSEMCKVMQAVITLASEDIFSRLAEQAKRRMQGDGG
jgi:hypothetical protein